MVRELSMLWDEAKSDDAVGAAAGGGGAAAATALDAGDKGASGDAAGAGGAAGGGVASGAEAGAKGYWPDDWQSRLAGGDEKALNQLKRYASPEDVWKKARSLEQRLSSGEYRQALPKDAKPEEIAQWRKDNGIPEAPTGYSLEGLPIKDEDKPLIDEFLTAAHARNMQGEQVKGVIEWWRSAQEKQVQARLEKDETERQTTLDALNQEWGGSFRRNVNLVEGFLQTFPESVRDALKAARLPDGTAMFNHPDVLRGFVSKALELNPAGVVVPNTGGDLGKTMVDEWKSIQETRTKNRPAYNKDTSMQERERALIDGMIKHGLMDTNGNLIDPVRRAA